MPLQIAGRWWDQRLYVTSVTTLTVVLNTVYYMPCYLWGATTIDAMAIYVSTIGTGGSTVRLGAFSVDTATGLPNTRIVDAGTVLVDATGPVQASFASTALSTGPGWVYLTLATAGSGVMPVIGGVPGGSTPYMFGGTTNNLNSRLASYSGTATGGAMPTTPGALTAVFIANGPVIMCHSA